VNEEKGTFQNILIRFINSFYFKLVKQISFYIKLFLEIKFKKFSTLFSYPQVRNPRITLIK
jgi:hypothetical protein